MQVIKMSGITKIILHIIGYIILALVFFGMISLATFWAFSVLSDFFLIPIKVFFALLVIYLLWIHKWSSKKMIKVKKVIKK